MYESEKNFLEDLADKIPGLKGYREKEARRDTDKRLREYLADQLDRARRGLDASKRELLGGGKLDLLDDVDRVGNKMQKAADGLRFASYGYSGLFDQVKIQEQELDALYRHDAGLINDVRAFEQRTGGIGAAPEPATALRELEGSVDELQGKIDERKQLFNNPG